MRRATECIQTNKLSRNETYLLMEAATHPAHEVAAACLEGRGTRTGLRRYRAIQSLIAKGIMTPTRQWEGTVWTGDGSIFHRKEISACKIQTENEKSAGN